MLWHARVLCGWVARWEVLLASGDTKTNRVSAAELQS